MFSFVLWSFGCLLKGAVLENFHSHGLLP